jgi:muramoyltetrapeptide carboxypeptidase
MSNAVISRLLKPERLQPGDVVGVVAPASAPPDPGAVDRAAAALQRLGFKPKLGRHVRARKGFLAGDDRERAADLMRMFTDRRVRGIVCLRGGYGAARLLDRLNYGDIRRNPKVFAGYSDITTLHCALARRARLVSFHSPMLNEGLGAESFPAFSNQSFLRNVCEPQPSGSLCAGYTGRTVRIVRRGVAEGRLMGGNLSVLMTTIGTPVQPQFRGRLLFIEDVGEKPYRLDRMLTHLLNAGLLQQVVGVAVGSTQDCEDPAAAASKEYRQSVADVFKERLGTLGVPVVTGLPFGHQPINATIPVGVRARLDGNAGDLIITEAAVR